MLNLKQQLLFETITTLSFPKVLRVEGAGGTGKTFTVAMAAKYLLDINPEINICVSTVTHQALANIKGKIEPEVATKLTFCTVASLLSKFMFSPALGTMALSGGNAGRASSFDLIIIDESSMVSERDANLLLKSTAKIIEMGDYAQLPPVMAKANKFKEFPGTKTIRLVEQMRNGGEIYKISTMCREHIVFPKQSKGNVLVHSTQDDLLREFIKKVKTLQNPTEAIFLAFTNARVNEVAALVHSELYGEDSYVVGQWLRLEQNIGIQCKGHNVQITSIGGTQEIMGIVGQQVEVAAGSDREWILVLPPAEAKRRDNRMKYLVEQSKKTTDAKLLRKYRSEYVDLELGFVSVVSPFALTIHKSQGQTIPFVFVDTMDVKKGRGGNKKNLLYVAYSRAATELNTVYVETQPQRDPILDEFKVLRKQIGYGPLHRKIKGMVPLDCRSPEGKAMYVQVYQQMMAK
jgi:hypothetical protein